MGTSILVDQCTCIRSPSDAQLFKDFYNSFIIRGKPHRDFFDLIRSKKCGSKDNLSDKKWLIIKECFLISEKNKDNTLSFWDNVVKFARETSNEDYLLLCLLFLCENNEENCKQYFLSFCSEICNFDINCIIKDKKMKKTIIENVLMLYLNVVSFLGVEYVKSNSGNEAIFTEKHYKIYDEANINDYLQNSLLKEYREEDWVDYEQFFEEKYDIIRDDYIIRYDILELAKRNSNFDNEIIEPGTLTEKANNKSQLKIIKYYIMKFCFCKIYCFVLLMKKHKQ